MHGVINLLKPPGMTSHDAVSCVRRWAGTKRVGHTGTLDPAAAGVLPLCVGHATRLVETIQEGTKSYTAEAVFGLRTDSHDTTGHPTSQVDASALGSAAIEAALGSFRGTLLQTPPLFSAVKQAGQQLYRLAHRGTAAHEVEIAARTVIVHDFRLLRFCAAGAHPRALLTIECGGGTYVRSLIRDLGDQLGYGAAMSFLVRTRSGLFTLDEAHTIEEVESDTVKALIPLRQILCRYAACCIEDDTVIEEYLAGRTRRSRAAEQQHRSNSNELAAARLLFVNTADTVALLSQPAGDGVEDSVSLFHLV